MEVFCGKARLSKGLRKLGFQVFSVDHRSCKGIPILTIDILSPKQVKILDELLSKGNLLYVHFAPPCGTASAARSIRLSKRRHGPPPLRSIRRPMGLSGLTPGQQKRVHLANALYQWTCRTILKLHARGVGWSVENPSSSLMWLTDPFQSLHKELKAELIAFAFHTCMFNAPRAKRTAIWTSVKQMLQLQRDCDGQHEHEPWGLTANNTFATAEECAYNAELAAHWSAAIDAYATQSGLQPLPQTLAQWHHDPTLNNDHVNKTVVGFQPRGHRVPPVMTDFLLPSKINIDVYKDFKRLPPGARLPSDAPFPSGSRLLRFVSNDTGGECETKHPETSHVIVGIPREPEDFVMEACKLVHPTNQPARLSKELEVALDVTFKGGSLELRKCRLKSANMIMKMMAEVKLEEDALHQSWPEHLRRVMCNKKLILFKRLLEHQKYEDAKVADEMTVGFPLNGWLPESGVFPPRLKMPEIHPEAFNDMIPSFSRRTLAAVKSSGDPELDRQLWDATCEEVTLGFVKGPFPASALPRGALVSPRFGLRQKNKLRPIDDLSISGVNMSTSLPERLKVDAIDECAAMIKEMMSRSGGKQALVGKTYDLRKAYRQLAIKEDH